MSEGQELDSFLEDVKLHKVQQQDHRTFSLLLERYGNRLLRSAYCMSKNQEEAEDLVQETFLQAFQAADKFRGQSKIYTWLYGIMLNCHRARRRKRKVHVDLDSVAEPESPELVIKESTRIEVIKDVVSHLNQDQAQIIRLRYYENRTVDEIARILDISKGTVKSRLHYAREKIRNKQNQHDPFTS